MCLCLKVEGLAIDSFSRRRSKKVSGTPPSVFLLKNLQSGVLVLPKTNVCLFASSKTYVRPEGLEPSTFCLKGSYSTIELWAENLGENITTRRPILQVFSWFLNPIFWESEGPETRLNHLSASRPRLSPLSPCERFRRARRIFQPPFPGWFGW